MYSRLQKPLRVTPTGAVFMLGGGENQGQVGNNLYDDSNVSVQILTLRLGAAALHFTFARNFVADTAAVLGAAYGG